MDSFVYRYRRRPAPIQPRPRPGSVPPPIPQVFTYHGIHRKTGKRYSIRIERALGPVPPGRLTRVLDAMLAESPS